MMPIFDIPKKSKDGEKHEDYIRHLQDWALCSAEDGESGCGIAGRMSNYKNELSFEDYKRGRRMCDI